MLPDEQPARQQVKPEQAHEEGPQPWPTAACWPVSACHVRTRRVCHCQKTPRMMSEKGTKCGLVSVSTPFQILPDSARRAFCAPSRWRWHADPPAGCTDTIMLKPCIGSLSICDSIARTAAFAFADGGRIQRRLARTADPKLSQLTVRISPSTCSTKSWNISRASCPRIAVAL